MTVCVHQSQQAEIPAILMVITEAILACVEDHQNNPDVISAWLANKTQAHLALWIAKNLSCTAMIDRQLVGFSMASFTGEILLNYVHPKFHRQGIGTAMLELPRDCRRLKHLREYRHEKKTIYNRS